MGTLWRVFSTVEFYNTVEIPIGENEFAGLKKGITAAIARGIGNRNVCIPATMSRI